MNQTVIIGSGNLAEALAIALQKAGVLRQIYARNAARAAEIGQRVGVAWTTDPQQIVYADFYLIAVSDRAVETVATQLSLPSTAIIAHTAGSVSLEAIPAAHHPRRASFYPFQTFTRGRVVDFAEIPLFIEGSDATVQAETEALAHCISGLVYPADSARRAQIHLAGVFANNFTNALYGVGAQIAQQAGLPFDVLRALIIETAAKATAATHPATVQTGPAVRGDAKVEEQHLQLLAKEPTLQAIYKLISQLIWETSKRTL
ncbi:MAG: DUF2520 domain-containing protein [Alistipes sp.]